MCIVAVWFIRRASTTAKLGILRAIDGAPGAAADLYWPPDFEGAVLKRNDMKFSTALCQRFRNNGFGFAGCFKTRLNV